MKHAEDVMKVGSRTELILGENECAEDPVVYLV